MIPSLCDELYETSHFYSPMSANYYCLSANFININECKNWGYKISQSNGAVYFKEKLLRPIIRGKCASKIVILKFYTTNNKIITTEKVYSHSFSKENYQCSKLNLQKSHPLIS